MRLTFREWPYDLFLALVAGLAILPLVAFGASWPERFVIGLAFVLFLPGYAMVAALFPGDGEVGWIERIAFSFGLSIAAVPLLGLLLNYTPWGVRLESVVVALLLFTLGVWGVAFWRRMSLPAGERLGLAIDLAVPGWKELAAVDKALTVGLVASIVLATGGIAVVVSTPRPPGQPFTEFYVLDSDGGIGDYPSSLNASEEAIVILGVVNHEFRRVNYTLEVRLVTLEFVYNETTRTNETVERASATLDSFPLSLSDAERWESPYPFAIGDPGEYRLRFLLFIGPANGDARASVFLRIHVA